MRDCVVRKIDRATCPCWCCYRGGVKRNVCALWKSPKYFRRYLFKYLTTSRKLFGKIPHVQNYFVQDYDPGIFNFAFEIIRAALPQHVLQIMMKRVSLRLQISL